MIYLNILHSTQKQFRAIEAIIYYSDNFLVRHYTFYLYPTRLRMQLSIVTRVVAEVQVLIIDNLYSNQ
jgi:hypothetical protein